MKKGRKTICKNYGIFIDDDDWIKKEAEKFYVSCSYIVRMAIKNYRKKIEEDREKNN